MPFDPTVPAPHADLTSQMFRDQFNGLNAKIDAQAAVIADLQAQINALKPHEAFGFGDARACGILTLMGMLQGKPYYRAAGGAWFFWSAFDGQWAVRFDQPDETTSCGDYFRAAPALIGPYANRSGTAPAGTVS